MPDELPQPVYPFSIVNDLMEVVRQRAGITRFTGDDLDVLLQATRTMMQGLAIPEAHDPEDLSEEFTHPDQQ